jgi:hypothetical protein
VLSLALIGGIAGGTYGATAPREYTARAYVVATGETPDPVAFARAYGRIATSGPVLARAATALGTDDLDDVTASTSKSAPVIEIAARNRSATRAAAAANAVGQALAAYGSERQTDVHVGLAVLAVATVPAQPSSPVPPRELLIGTSAGLLAGAVAALFTLRRPVTRPTFENPAEIEGHLRIWRAQYGQRSVTAYRGAASLTEPPAWPSAGLPPETDDDPPATGDGPEDEPGDRSAAT